MRVQDTKTWPNESWLRVLQLLWILGSVGSSKFADVAEIAKEVKWSEYLVVLEYDGILFLHHAKKKIMVRLLAFKKTTYWKIYPSRILFQTQN